MFIAIAVSLIAGALATSLIEYFLKYNLIDKIVDLFKGGEKSAIAGIKKL